MTALIAACAPQSQPRPDENEAFSQASGLPAHVEVSTPRAELDAAWQAILQDPGEAGVDYDPTLLTVTYFEGARLSQDLQMQLSSPGACAADQPYPRLRKLPGYEAITDSIASRYGLGIEAQIYVDGMTLAGFSLQPGQDGDAVISDMRKRYSAQVRYVTYSRLMRAAYTPNDPDFINSNANGTGAGQWGLKRIGCEAAWDISRGSAAVQIAVVDSGVRLSHEEFVGSNVLNPEVSFPGENLDVRNNDNTVEDTNGHGTFIAGLVAAHTDNGRTIAGVAHNCQVIPIKIANGGVTADFRMNQGVTLAVDLGAEIVNLSWGGTSPTPNLEDLVNYCIDNDVLFVCAAGNDNTSNPDYPGAYPDSFCVGATDPIDFRAVFSNFGDYVDIAAPGEVMKSCGVSNDADYAFEAGTSFAAPIVAASAGLLLSADPSLTPDQLREVLLSTTVPTTGFSLTNPIGRLNLAAAIELVSDVEVQAPQLSGLVQSGTVPLTPTIIGKPDKVELYANGALVQTINSAPYDFSYDSSAVSFGQVALDFIAYRAENQSSLHMEIVVDNLNATYPVQESFEGPVYSFASLDAKRGYSDALLNQLILLPSSDWDAQKLAANGTGQWRYVSQAPFEGSFNSFCGTPTLSYGAYEADCLISRRISLAGISNSSMVFYEQHNLEDGGIGLDRTYILGSLDGLAWVPLSFNGQAGPAFLTGSNFGWTRREIDLSDFDGQSLYLAFVLVSNGSTPGESPGDSGFWLDKVTIASDFNEDVATISGVNLTPYDVYGSVPDHMDFDLSVSQPVNVESVSYILDFAPLGVSDPYDEVLDVSDAPFSGLLSLPSPNPDLHNQLANLVVRYYDSANVPGPELVIPVYIFNQLGDTTADGQVTQADLDAYQGKVGLSSQDPGYVPFFDSDLDGVITELDSAAVGYFFGSTL
ncbi:S8 family serine peptidase [bacterium]|nr:S8 family serine peptidase [bacterium]